MSGGGREGKGRGGEEEEEEEDGVTALFNRLITGARLHFSLISP